MSRTIEEVLAAAFPGSIITKAERPGVFIVTSSELYLRVETLQMPNEHRTPARGTFENMTVRPGVNWFPPEN